MSGPPSKPSQPTPSTFNERLNEQLINCLNVQTNVIQNLSQYSQHISLQLFEIKSIVEILSNRVLALQQQQQQQQQPHYPPSPYGAPYYPTYMHPPPPMPIPHPPPVSHPPPSVPFSMPQQPPAPTQMRIPATSAAPPSSNIPFFSSTPANPPAPLSSNTHPFQFSTSTAAPSSQTTNTKPLSPVITTAAATTTMTTTTSSPSKSIFSSLPKFGVSDSTTTTKPVSLSTNTTTITTAPTTSVTPGKPTNISPFVFGINNATPIFGTAGLPSFSTVKPETHADEEGDGEGADDSYDPDHSFTAIVQLAPVEVKTGEEEENVLFCERGKLYRFDTASNQMKERGIGEMKILQHKTTNICRILMRREQVLKICANHQITSQMELKPHQGAANAYLWSAMDFADGEAKHETLCIRFKSDEQAKKFSKVFNEAKEINMKRSGDAPSVEKSSSIDETKPKTNSNDDDVVSIGEVKPSAEQIDRAKKLQLPSTFYLYENKEPCKGCPGCKEDSPTAMSDENKVTTTNPTDVVKTETKTTTPLPQPPSSAPKTPLSSSENIKFSFNNAEKQQQEQQPQLQKQSSIVKEEKSSVESSSPAPSAVASQYDSKPSIFGNFAGTSVFGDSASTNNTSNLAFGASASFKPNNGTSGFSFPGFGAATTAAPTNGFQFSSLPSASTSTTTSSSPAPFSFGAALASAANAKPVFGNAPKFSFADVAKQSPTLDDKGPSNGAEQRVFAGQGSLVFGTSPVLIHTKAPTQNEEEEGDAAGGEDDSYEPNVSFKPIVQLSAVEVKTGEEEENVLFCERGKLYRFDAEANQMKERGIGEMKILQHKTTKNCRILMRREQVLKLCANHQITSQMELKPHQGSENAYVWSAMDFADGEAKHETLCIRFKSDDQAKRFLKTFNEAKQANTPN